MTINLKGVHYSISERTKEFIEEKLGNIDPFKDLIVNMDLTVTKEPSEFRVDSNVHFKWGTSVHLHETAQELYPAIENLIHKLDSKVSKEKEKARDHNHETMKEKEVL